MAQKFATIDEYIATFPENVQEILEEVRRTIHAAVPGADETISYHMPTIAVDGKSVVTFAGWKKHIALYPAPSGDADYERDIAKYRTETATLNFPLKDPIPYPLIGRSAALLAAQVGQGD
jgi:uncharacterized protein YdhG (YjbR/CyaY superfamily)